MKTIKRADRIGHLKPYFFAALNHRIAKLRARGIDVIRLDVGSPDMPPAPHIIQALTEAVSVPGVHGYTPYGGTVEYRQAVKAYYQNRYSVNLDPRNEVLGLIGSKEGIFHLSQAILNPGDLVLIPSPAYPTYSSGALIAGAEIRLLPLRPENQFLPDLKSINPEVLHKAKLIWLNYPNNPTGGTASAAFFQEIIEIAIKYNLIVAHDAPYTDITYDGYRAPSLLETPGAINVAVEFNSLSKTYNMAGWRTGMVVGNSEILSQIDIYKQQVDSAHFGPILAGAIAALQGDQIWIIERNQIYQTRRDLITKKLSHPGLVVYNPKGALYVWVQLPDGIDSSEFCAQLLQDTGVSITPGEVFGRDGKGFVRISICTPTDQIEEAIKRIAAWLPDFHIHGKT